MTLAAREEAVTAGTTAQYTQAFCSQFSQWGDGRWLRDMHRPDVIYGIKHCSSHEAEAQNVFPQSRVKKDVMKRVGFAVP